MTVHKFKGIKSPIKWMGGKALRATWILSFMKAIPHDIYVEPFGGAASLMFGKEPIRIEVYNDIDSGLVNFFKVLADTKLFDEFHRFISVLPHSRELYCEYRKTWELEENQAIKAAKWFLVARQSFSGKFAESWGYAKGPNRSVSHTFLKSIDRLPECHARFQGITIEHNDWRKILSAYDTPNTLFYLDPPYAPDSRVGSHKYKHELIKEDHEEMVEKILELKGSVVLSSYPTKLYEPLLAAGFRLETKEISCNAAGRTKGTGLTGKGSISESQKRTECLYIKEK